MMLSVESVSIVGAARIAIHDTSKAAAGPGQGGRIITMASHAVRGADALVAVHCATTAVVISLTQSANLNLIAHGNNAAAPGPVGGDHAVFARSEAQPFCRNDPGSVPQSSCAPLRILAA